VTQSRRHQWAAQVSLLRPGPLPGHGYPSGGNYKRTLVSESFPRLPSHAIKNYLEVSQNLENRPLHYVALDKLVPILVNTPLMLFETVVIAAVAPRAMIAATRAYSIRSCPDSSLIRPHRIFLQLVHSLMLIILDLLYA
jgi:hypothetical protein